MKRSLIPREYAIAIPCVCGIKYNSDSKGNRCKCPNCGHVWVLDPPNPQTPKEIEEAAERLRENGRIAYEKAQLRNMNKE